MARFYFQGFDGKWYVADDHTTSMLEVLQRRLDGAYKRLMDKESQMTTLEKIREEIYKKSVQMHFDGNFYNKTDEVLQIIDKYADQEPCDDAVSRDLVQKEINCWIGSGEYRYAMPERFLIDRINNLPSVRPQEPQEREV